MEWKWFPRRINVQIAVMVLVTTATFQVVITLAAYITEIVRPSHQRLLRKDVVEQLVEIESNLDRDSLERAVERLFPPAMWTTVHEVGPVPPVASWIGMAAFSALTFAILILWATRQVTQPLRAFAEAAETFSLESEPADLPELGPREVRVAARAFNRMQDKIERLIRERTEMLASIGHDLRTPITRLRLRAEFMDHSMRVAVTRDLNLMARLVDGALAHLRDGRWSPSPSEVFCLADFVERVCEDFSDTGASVEFNITDRPVVLGRSEDIERALNSLIDNAIKYGSRAHVRVLSRADMAVVEVEDDGPGIPEGEEEYLMEPFTRGEPSSSGSGFGLGLSTVKAIAIDHGGYLRLANSTRAGLLAQFAIPIGGGRGQRALDLVELGLALDREQVNLGAAARSAIERPRDRARPRPAHASRQLRSKQQVDGGRHGADD
jgi:signal transduction histidine kinase